MSSTLIWRPATAGEKDLPDELKFALKYLDEFNQSIDRTIGEGYLPVLRGMKAAGVKGADKLIAAIEKYGEIELKERW